MVSYEKHKKNILKWRHDNADIYREYDRKYKLAHYVPVLFYKWETESRRLRNINVF